MASTFLGKPTPKDKPRSKKAASSRTVIELALIVLAPLVLAGSVLFLLFTDFTVNSVRAPEPTPAEPILLQSIRALSGPATASEKASEVAKKAAAKAKTTCNFSLNKDDTENYVNPNKIFPIVPKELLDKCPSTNWNLDVVRYFIYKALTFVNWLAAALAILLTITGGLYYMAGFANEANVKKGKTIITTAYVGLVLVVLARVIVYGSIQFFNNGSSYNPSTDPITSTPYLESNP